MKATELLATIGKIVGMALISIQNPIGFVVNILGSILWAYLGYKSKLNGLIIVNIILIIININGLLY